MILWIFMMFSCQNSVRGQILESSIARASPDGKSVLYQSFYEKQGDVFTSIDAWLEVGGLEGGGGVFNMVSKQFDTLQVLWTSDTTAVIAYPDRAIVSKQEPNLCFAGKTIHLSYKSVAH